MVWEEAQPVVIVLLVQASAVYDAGAVPVEFVKLTVMVPAVAPGVVESPVGALT
jgi:hypothetical protein